MTHFFASGQTCEIGRGSNTYISHCIHSLSPTLFNIYINDLATKIERSSSPGLKLLNKEIKCLLFADDLLLLSPSPEALQESLNIINEYSITWALPINLDKSKIIVFQKRHSKHNNYYSFTVGEEKFRTSDFLNWTFWWSNKRSNRKGKKNLLHAQEITTKI